MLETHERNSRKKLVATILAVIVIAGAVVFADYLKTKGSTTSATLTPTSTTTTAPTTTADAANTASVASANTYKDGTYTATSDYFVPHGNESIEVSLTLSNGVVTDASIQNSEGDNDSAAYQEDFAASYKSHVVGQKISGLKLSNIAGASDTTQGFNDALAQIATKAQA